MPDLEQLDQFNQDLIKIGNEPAVAAQRGEEIEKPLTPEEYPLDKLGPMTTKTNRSSDGGKDDGEDSDDAKPAGGGGAKSGGAGSFDDLFGDIGEPDAGATDSDAGASAEPPSMDDLFGDVLGKKAAPEEAPAPEADDFSGLFDDEVLAGVSPSPSPDLDDKFDTPSEDLAEPTADEPSADDLLAGLGDTDFGEDAPADGQDLGDLFDSTPTDDAPPAFDSGAAATDDAGDFGDLGDLGDLGNLDVGDAAPADTTDSGFDDLGAPDTSLFDLGAQSEAPAAAPGGEPEDLPPDFSTDLSADFGTETFADEFDMGDFGKDFGVMEEVTSDAFSAPQAEKNEKPAEAKPKIVEEAEEEIAKATAADEAREYKISNEDFRRIQTSLSAMPLNLKVATEELLANPDIEFANLKIVINALIRGDSPNALAPLVSRYSGKKIRIPAGYEKKSGLAFEAEQRTFAYRFQHVILPMLRTAVLSLAGLAIVVYLAYSYIYKPLHANGLYEQGLAAIHDHNFDVAPKFFTSAYDEWPDNNRFLDYAKAYIHEKRPDLGRITYEQLLGSPTASPRPVADAPDGGTNYLSWRRAAEPMHRVGILEYANYLSIQEKKWTWAVDYLQRLIDANNVDHDARLLQGDTFLEWARYASPTDRISFLGNGVGTKEVSSWDPAQGKQDDAVAILYEAARKNFTSLIAKEGQTDLLLSRMLVYFMRTGKEERVQELKNLFLNDEKAKPEPRAIAELAGNIIDSSEGNLGLMEEAYKLGLKSMKNDEVTIVPGLPYQMARYLRASQDKALEERYLKGAAQLFEGVRAERALDRFETVQYIDDLIRQGEILYGTTYNTVDSLSAQAVWQKAETEYEAALQTRLIPKPMPILGRVYARLGDLQYYNSKLSLESALQEYVKARQHGFGIMPSTTSSEGEVQEPVSVDRPDVLKVRILPRGDAGVPRLTQKESVAAAEDIAYKMGFIYYNLGSRYENLAKPTSSTRENRLAYFDQSLREFIGAQGPIPLENANLELAIGNAQFRRGNYEAAAAVYRILIDRLNSDRKMLRELISSGVPEALDLSDFLVRSYNNLAVSTWYIARGNYRQQTDQMSQAQFLLTRASEIAQENLRDKTTAARSDKIPLTNINLKIMMDVNTSELGLRQISTTEPQIYPDLRQDLRATRFSEGFVDASRR